LLPETDTSGAEETGQRIASAVRERADLDGGFPVSLSYGASTFGRDGRTLDDLTRAADKALYVAKRCGRSAGSSVAPLSRHRVMEDGEAAASASS
jgi:GGDEF domain-containing protein